MAVYNTTFGQNSKVVPALVIPAFAYLPLLFLFFEYFPDLGEITPIAISILYMAFTFGTVFFLLRKINLPVAVSVEPSFIKVSFLKKGWFIPNDFHFSIEGIKNHWEEEDKGYAFMHFSLATKPSAFYFNANMGDPNGRQQFLALQQDLLTQINTAVISQKVIITSKSMYEQWWAKILALLAIVMIIAFPIMKFVQGPENTSSWLQYLAVLCFGGVFVGAVYYHNFVKNK